MATKTVGELSHGELEYWVAKAQGEQFILMGPDGPFLDIKGLCIRLHYTRDLEIAGPIIRDLKMMTRRTGMVADQRWEATLPQPDGTAIKQSGRTRLEAAMRCYVASCLGPEVEAMEWPLYKGGRRHRGAATRPA